VSSRIELVVLRAGVSPIWRQLPTFGCGKKRRGRRAAPGYPLN